MQSSAQKGGCFQPLLLALREYTLTELDMLFSYFVVPTLCDPVNCSMPSSSVLRYLPQFVQIQVH